MPTPTDYPDATLIDLLNSPDDFTKQEAIGHLRVKYGEAIHDAIRTRFPELELWEVEHAVNGVFDRLLQFARKHPIRIVDGSINPFLVTIAWGRAMDVWRSHSRKRALLLEHTNKYWFVQRDSFETPVPEEDIEILISSIGKIIDGMRLPFEVRLVYWAIATLVLTNFGWKLRGQATPSPEAIQRFLKDQGHNLSINRIISIRKALGDLTRRVLHDERWFIYREQYFARGRKKDGL